MEMWVQGALFENEPPSPRTRRAAGRPVLGGRKSRHVGWLPVTRDPDIALSHGESVRTASDFRLGLARAMGHLPPESRLAIRRAVDPSHRKTAA
jgi:hypothetical protein